MGLEQKLSLRLSQRLVMTPTLQQAIKLLQMTRLELQDVVNQELVSNPVLEEQDPESGATPDEDSGAAETRERELADTPGTGPAEIDALGEEGDGAAEQAASQPEAPAPEPVIDPAPTETMEDALGDIDLEAYFGDYMDGTATAPRMSEQAEEFSLENRADAPPGLEPHLTEQLGVSDAPPGIREACGFMIGNVDPDGCLRVTLDEVCAALPCSMETAEKALALLQSFDPCGVGGRDLAEILLLQARAANIATPLVVELVTHRFAELGSKPAALLARQMNVSLEDIQQAHDLIRTLDPKPGRAYDSSRTIYVEPDVAVVKVEDEYVILFNDDGLPRLRVSALYRRMLLARDGALDGEGKSYLREKMRAAQWLLKSLDQRKRTIVRVAESIVKKQHDFFDYGVAHLRPLVLRDVAEDIGMHESTVSRVVSNKWMATPRGLVPMKFFFHSAIASSVGEDVSSLAVKGKIRSLVEAEDPAHPLSDARLAELLLRDGIRIARRTVAKYREELRIPASSIRRVGESAAEAAPAPEPDQIGEPDEIGERPGRPQGGTMKTTFTARHVRLHPRLREIVEAKLAKLSRTLPADAEARVVVTAGKKDLEVEVSVAGRHGTLTAAARAGDQASAAQDVMDRIAAQAVKSRTKVSGVKKRSASPVRNPGAWPAESAAETSRHAGPRREAQAPRAMFEEDALTAFAASRREVLVFRDPASHHALRFLYRRKDGTLGLVVPE